MRLREQSFPPPQFRLNKRIAIVHLYKCDESEKAVVEKYRCDERRTQSFPGRGMTRGENSRFPVEMRPEEESSYHTHEVWRKGKTVIPCTSDQSGGVVVPLYRCGGVRGGQLFSIIVGTSFVLMLWISFSKISRLCDITVCDINYTHTYTYTQTHAHTYTPIHTHIQEQKSNVKFCVMKSVTDTLNRLW